MTFSSFKYDPRSVNSDSRPLLGPPLLPIVTHNASDELVKALQTVESNDEAFFRCGCSRRWKRPLRTAKRTMDTWTLLLVCVLVVSSSLGSTANQTSPGKSQGRGKSRRSGVSQPDTRYRWDGVLAEDSVDDGSKKSRAKCVDIPQTMSLCRGIGYLKMRLPNLLGHETLAEVQHEAASWTPLLSTRCSVDAQLFLCSLFSPVCLDQTIWPCRSLCLAVKLGCEAQMASHGYPWPDMLDCDKLPSDNDLCIGIQPNRSSSRDATNGQSSCRICESMTSGAKPIMSSFCQAEFVAKVKPDFTVISGNDLKIMPTKKVKFFKTPAVAALQKRRQTFYVLDGAKCDCFDVSNAGHYIVMGHVTDKQRMVLTSALKFDVRSKTGKQVLRALKKSDKCPAVNTGRQEVVETNVRGISPSDQKMTKSSRKREKKFSNRESDMAGNKGATKSKKRRRKESNRNRSKNRNPRKISPYENEQV